MSTMIPYDREAAVRYAHRWSHQRNPAYYDYETLGGDCTNFVSQCIFAGTGVMNFTPTFGWYYINANEKSPSWTGVPYFYDFMARTEVTPGPLAIPVVRLALLQPGDVVQLRHTPYEEFGHTALIVAASWPSTLSQILVSAHSQNSDFRPLSSYQVYEMRFLHLMGVVPQSV